MSSNSLEFIKQRIESTPANALSKAFLYAACVDLLRIVDDGIAAERERTARRCAEIAGRATADGRAWEASGRIRAEFGLDKGGAA